MRARCLRAAHAHARQEQSGRAVAVSEPRARAARPDPPGRSPRCGVPRGGLREPPTIERPRVRRWLLSEERIGRRRWPVAELETAADLAELLELDLGRLDWLADVRGLERSVVSEQLRNYRYLWLPRAAAPPRAAEPAKSMLKAAQRQVLREVLDH